MEITEHNLLSSMGATVATYINTQIIKSLIIWCTQNADKSEM